MARNAMKSPPPYKPSYIKAWRKKCGYTLKQTVAMIIELAGEAGESEDPSKRVPRTEASLSRIENGLQPYTQATLEVLAEVFQTKPSYLIERDPSKEGKVILMIDRASPSQLAQIEAVVEAIMRDGTDG